MPEIVFAWDSREIERWQDKRILRAVERTLRMAGRDAIRAIRADGKRRVRARKRIRAEYLADRALPLTFPARSAPIDAMVWEMGVSGKRVPLMKYPARQVRAGVSVEVNKGQRKIYRGAFIAKMKSGHTGVFVRTGKARLPIEHALSSRAVDVFEDRGMADAVLDRGYTVMRSAFYRLLPLELGKIGRMV